MELRFIGSYGFFDGFPLAEREGYFKELKKIGTIDTSDISDVLFQHDDT
jgi:hypothetical protein